MLHATKFEKQSQGEQELMRLIYEITFLFKKSKLEHFVSSLEQTKCLLIDIYFIQVCIQACVYIPLLGSVRES